MGEITPSFFWGYLTFDRLFIGSKSEGLYPMLHADQGLSYRLHVKGEGLADGTSLQPFAGRGVKVLGCADNTRGHWRIVFDAKDLCLVDEIAPRQSEVTFNVIAKLKPPPSEGGEAGKIS